MRVSQQKMCFGLLKVSEAVPTRIVNGEVLTSSDFRLLRYKDACCAPSNYDQ